jgi:hypothetical protein
VRQTAIISSNAHRSLSSRSRSHHSAARPTSRTRSQAAIRQQAMVPASSTPRSSPEIAAVDDSSSRRIPSATAPSLTSASPS